MNDKERASEEDKHKSYLRMVANWLTKNKPTLIPEHELPDGQTDRRRK